MRRLELWAWGIAAAIVVAVGLIVAQIAEVEERLKRW